MSEPIERRGQWWYEQPDGTWLRWNEAAASWEPTATPPPPPDHAAAPPPPQGLSPSEVLPRGGSQPPAQSPEPGLQWAPTESPAAGAGWTSPAQQQQPAAQQPAQQRPAAQQPVQQQPAAQQGAPSYPVQSPADRPPADQLIVSESYVVSTQQRGSVSVPPQTSDDPLRIEHVAPNVSRVSMPQGTTTQVSIDPTQQVGDMAALKLDERERQMAFTHLQILARCLAAGERLVGLAAGKEQATGWGLIGVTDRQILFVGNEGADTQLFCPLDDIELVGYEDLGGVARLSVTAHGRVTTWRDVPTLRAAEIAQLVENRGAMARAVAPPVSAAPGLPADGPALQPRSSAPIPSGSMVSAGDVAVYRSEPRPVEILLPETERRSSEGGLKERTGSFFRDLWNDPGQSSSFEPRSRSTRRNDAVMKARLMAAGSIVLGLASLGMRIYYLWIAVALGAVLLGYSTYQRNRVVTRDTVTEALSIGGMLIGGVVLVIAILYYF